jgi:pimeloyl-ACP methyl ester carboxylesterase
MKTETNVHRVVAADGTEIAARVQGEGPPLVLLPAGPGDSEISWQFVVPHLRDRFTCYLLNTRGRGLSADHPDHAPQRLVEDIKAFVESLGQPVGLVEWASFVGAAQGLAAARGTDAVAAVATYEPIVLAQASEDEAAQADALFARVGELAARGRLADAARTFVETWNAHGFYTEEDMANGATYNFWSASQSSIPLFLHELEQAHDVPPPAPEDPSELAKTTVPVLLLKGARTHPLHGKSVQYVAEHVADSRVREIAGASHYGPHNQAAAVAEELASFFSARLAA